MFRGIDLRKFALETIGALVGGFISEQVVKHPEIFGALGEYATPVTGIIAGLLGQYLETQGTIPRELALLLEYGGAFTLGNWIYEFISKGGGFKALGSGTTAQIVYVPPEIKKVEEGIVT